MSEDPISTTIRQPAAAGQFYPGQREELERTVKDLIGPGPAQKALGVVVPHAGYKYSGRVAGAVYGAVDLPEVFIILGPNHTGMGAPASIMTAGTWRMPGGDVPIDTELAGEVLENSRLLEENAAAHLREHSIEVQLPFLQYMVGQPLIVPISLMISRPEQCLDIGEALAAAIREFPAPVLIVASSDMSHYESQATAQQKDKLALEQILQQSPEGLLKTVRENQISMCGAAPVATMLYACRELGAGDARLIRYETSGDVTGDYGRVVGYAGVAVNPARD